MLLIHAARLLADARSLDALTPLARAAGVTAPFTTLPRTARDRLAPGALARARVAAGPGSLHALLADLHGPPLRDTATCLAAQLATTTPHHHWLLVLRHTGDGTCALVAWHPTPRAPHIAALRFHPDTITASDADTLRTLAARTAAATSPLLTHVAWLDVLGRDALSARFYRTLERTVAALASSLPASVANTAARADLALLCTTRLLFLAFLEAKGWLDNDGAFLTRHYDATMATGGRVHARTLRPLFFGTLNTPRRHRAPAARAFGRVPFLNGGLFAPTALERRHRTAYFGDEPLGRLVHTLLAGHRFTAHEDAPSWSEAAVDPEMLGRAFEQLMSARDRETTGAFYTPRPLVEHASTEALRHTLADVAPLSVVDATLAGTAPDASIARQLHTRASTLRLLDPACGSGAFLVHALERLATLLATCGDPRSVADRRQAVLAHAIFGVDLNPTAVWLCELRLWLSVVVERETPDPHAVPPLPNLDHNIRVGDALAVPPGLELLTHGTWGGAPWGAPPHPNATRANTARPHSRKTLDAEAVAALRTRYSTLAGPRKLAAARRLEAAERAHALATLDRTLDRLRHARTEALTAARTRDLFGERAHPTPTAQADLATLRHAVRTLAARRRALSTGSALPFGFGWHFADAGSAGGFDLLLGNPPWVRPHAMPAATRTTLRTHYAVARTNGLQPRPPAPPSFGHQVDLAALFIERALALTRPGGVTALLVPAKLWRTLSGTALRALVHRETHLLALDDWSDAPSTFDAAVYPSLLVARRRPLVDVSPEPNTRQIHIRVHHNRTHTTTATVSPAHLSLDPATPASPWLLLPPAVRDAFDTLRAAGPALAHTALTHPTLGVKCGCNDAFLVHLDHVDGGIAHVHHGDRHGMIEHALLRPAIRGEHLTPARAGPTPTLTLTPAADRLLWPYDATGRLLTTLPPHAAHWLAPWRERLAARSDAHGPAPWWTLFRTDGADSSRPRVVWPDLARAPHPRILPTGDPHIPLNTCYVARFDDVTDARAFAALLASPPIAAWLATLAEPARGGYRRFLAWTVALLPIPRDWQAARALLAPLGPTAPPDQLAHAAATVYGLPLATFAPLLTWPPLAAAPPISSRIVPAVPVPAPSPPAHSSPPLRLIREPAWATRWMRRPHP